MEQKLGNPVHHIHNGQVPGEALPVTYSLLLNLIGVLGAQANEDAIWKLLERYGEGITRESNPDLAKLVPLVLAYYRDVVASTLQRRAPTPLEAEALGRLDSVLAELPQGASAEDIQNHVYEIGKTGGFDNLRDWFKALYETLLGSEQGPRMGSFIALYGIENSRKLIAEALGRA